MANVLVIGSGGREHAIIWSVSKSNKINQLYAIPGNAGIADIAQCYNLSISDFAGILDFCNSKVIDLVIVGPEQPLSDGLTDFLEQNNIKVFGCSKETSQLESSKAYTKSICDAAGINTAAYQVCHDIDESKAYLTELNQYPIVIKADGLAAGKGVIIAECQLEAFAAVEDIFSGTYGKQDKVVIEEYLEGPEISFFAVSDGTTVKSIGTAGDHKKIGEGDTGLNTGGMGTYSPSPFAQDENQLLNEFALPAIEYLKSKNTPFKGVLFCGIILTDKGPYLLEYNVRFGDPETQSILTRLKTDFLSICLSCANETLSEQSIDFYDCKSITVVLAAKGYPLSYQKGSEIRNLLALSDMEDVNVFHAGTSIADNKLVANGGRVLNINATGTSFKSAYDLVYKAVGKVDWHDMYYRKDIALKVVNS